VDAVRFRLKGNAKSWRAFVSAQGANIISTISNLAPSLSQETITLLCSNALREAGSVVAHSALTQEEAHEAIIGAPEELQEALGELYTLYYGVGLHESSFTQETAA